MKDFSEINRQDLKEIEGYKSADYYWEKVKADDINHIYLFKAREDLAEMVKGKKYTNPDGSIVYAMPSSNNWGKYGWTFWGPAEMIEKKWEEKRELLLSKKKKKD